MICPRCGTDNAAGALKCSRCGINLGVGDDSETFAGIVAAPVATSGAAAAAVQMKAQESAAGDAATAGPWTVVSGTSAGGEEVNFGPRYKIQKKLGEGGMGAVYKALDTELDRTVALKLIRPGLAMDANVSQRFKQELLLASKVTHKNILRIHDLGDANGVKFISMAYVEGNDLHQLLADQGKLPVERALNIAKQLCAALDAAHAEGVVHRDFKPQNILLDKNDQVYVTDFGLAKSLETDAGLSRSGEFLGTPRYMAPEQVEGRGIDHRVDIYALGLILYEMLTGDVPFHADSTIQLMYKRVHEEPKSPKTLNPDLPDWLVKVVMKCLERDPQKRYQNASDVRTDLQNAMAPVGTKSGSIAFTVRRVELEMPGAKLGVIIAVALVVIIGGLLAIPRVRQKVFGDQAAPTIEAKHVAVLPIKVLGDEGAVGYIGQGVTDDLTARLFQLKNLQIASPTAIAKLKPGTTAEQAAKTLGASLVLKGTLQSQQDRIALVLTLNDASGKQIWTDRFSGVKQDLLTIEDEVYNKVVAALAVKTTTEEMARSSTHATENYAAYDLYLKGKNAFTRGELDSSNVEKAIGFYEDALKRDPHFALAWAGIADASLRMYKDKKEDKWSQKALNAAEQASTWGGDMPEVHFSVGSVYSATGKTAEAIAELQSALKLAPNSDEGWRKLGDAYRAAGNQQAEAMKAYQEAVRVNPYYWINYNALGGAAFRFGLNDDAMAAYKKVTELAPTELAGWLGIANTLFQQSRWDEAIAAYKKAIEVQPHYLAYSNLGTVYYYRKQYAEAAQAFEKAVELNPNQQLAIGNLADAYLWSGQKDKANAAYDKAIGLALKALQVDPKNAEEMGSLAMYYASKGDTASAKRYIQRARAIAPNLAVLAYTEAVVHTRAGELQPAFASLQEAFNKGYSVEQAKSDPELNVLAGQPEFDRLVKQYAEKK